MIKKLEPHRLLIELNFTSKSHSVKKWTPCHHKKTRGSRMTPKSRIQRQAKATELWYKRTDFRDQGLPRRAINNVTVHLKTGKLNQIPARTLIEEYLTKSMIDMKIPGKLTSIDTGSKDIAALCPIMATERRAPRPKTAELQLINTTQRD